MTDNTGFLTIILYIMLAGMFVLAVAFAFVYMNMNPSSTPTFSAWDIKS